MWFDYGEDCGQLRITCYWTQRKPRIYGSRSAKIPLSRIFYEWMTNGWRGYPSLSYRDYGNKTTYVGITMLNRQWRKPARDCILWGNVGKQTYLQRSASPYIVQKYANFSNMPPQCGAVCRRVPCRRVAVYAKKAPTVDIIGIKRTSLPTLEDRCNVATKRELERIMNDIKLPNQIFLT